MCIYTTTSTCDFQKILCISFVSFADIKASSLCVFHFQCYSHLIGDSAPKT